MRSEHNDWDYPLSWQRGLVNAARTVQEEWERRNGKIQALWLACETQEAIAEPCGCDRATIARTVDDFVQIVSENHMHKAAASHATDFDLPLSNIWKQQDKTPGMRHYGSLDALLEAEIGYTAGEAKRERIAATTQQGERSN